VKIPHCQPVGGNRNAPALITSAESFDRQPERITAIGFCPDHFINEAGY